MIYPPLAQQLLQQSQGQFDASTQYVCRVAECSVQDLFAGIQTTYRNSATPPQTTCPYKIPISFWLPPKDVNIDEVLQKMGFKFLSSCADPNNPVGITYWVSIPQFNATDDLHATPAQMLYLNHLQKLDDITAELEQARKNTEAEVFPLASSTAAAILACFHNSHYTSVFNSSNHVYLFYIKLDDPALRSLDVEKRKVFSRLVYEELTKHGIYPECDVSAQPVLSAPAWNFPEMTVVFSCKEEIK